MVADWMYQNHRHLSDIDCLTAHTACLVCFISTLNGCSKKIKRSLWRRALVAGTKQTLSNLFWRLSITTIRVEYCLNLSLSICVCVSLCISVCQWMVFSMNARFSSTSCLRLCFAVADERIENFFVHFQQQIFNDLGPLLKNFLRP
jgi:hypothetical protein